MSAILSRGDECHVVPIEPIDIIIHSLGCQRYIWCYNARFAFKNFENNIDVYMKTIYSGHI